MINVKEEWRPVVEWEDYYEVSNLGRVRSTERIRIQGPGKSLLKPHILKENTRQGYANVRLSAEGRSCLARVHRLVAMAFIPNPCGYPIINHKDENKSNNIVSNLEWCTYKYNSNYGNAIAKKVASTNKPVVIYNIISGKSLRFKSVKEAGKFLNVEPSNVTACCKRKKNATRNHVCRYAEERITEEDIRKAIDRFKPVVQMDLCGKTIKTFSTMSEAARETKTQLSNLCLCCQGKQKYSNGFKWRYKNG